MSATPAEVDAPRMPCIPGLVCDAITAGVDVAALSALWWFFAAVEGLAGGTDQGTNPGRPAGQTTAERGEAA